MDLAPRLDYDSGMAIDKEEAMAERIPCPNCERPISADLLIYHNERGYSMVALGMQCRTCKRTYPDMASHVMTRLAEQEASRIVAIGFGEGE